MTISKGKFGGAHIRPTSAHKLPLMPYLGSAFVQAASYGHTAGQQQGFMARSGKGGSNQLVLQNLLINRADMAAVHAISHVTKAEVLGKG